LARFSRTLAALTRSGVGILEALDIVAETAGNRVVAQAVLNSRESVRAGNLLSEPLMKAPVFPPMVVRMIAIGERTGALEALLEKIAEFYDAQVKAAVKSLTSMIEPLLITVMGVIVGGVVMSVFLPILDVVGKLGSQDLLEARLLQHLIPFRESRQHEPLKCPVLSNHGHFVDGARHVLS
jgi:type IV pilus assembly protein PilC